MSWANELPETTSRMNSDNRMDLTDSVFAIVFAVVFPGLLKQGQPQPRDEEGIGLV